MYFDNAATTKPFEEIIDNISSLISNNYANPNSIHKLGQEVKNQIEKVRIDIASYLKINPENLVFTSGATEGNNTILKSLLFKRDEDKEEILISPIEHKSVLVPAKFLAQYGFKIKFLKIDKNGRIDLEYLKKNISKRTALVCVIHANNETGVIQDISSISRICKEYDVLFFSDTVQSFLKEDFNSLDLDFFTISSHKINSLKGCGLLYVKDTQSITPLLHGGGQEHGIRSGTQNVEGILSFGIAFKKWVENKNSFIDKLKSLRDLFEKSIKEKIPDVEIVSKNTDRICHISNIIFPKVDAQSMIAALSSRGIYVSSGSACTSGTPTPSHVLLAYGYSEEEALRSIRFSFGIHNTSEEITEGIEIISKVFNMLYSLD